MMIKERKLDSVMKKTDVSLWAKTYDEHNLMLLGHYNDYNRQRKLKICLCVSQIEKPSWYWKCMHARMQLWGANRVNDMIGVENSLKNIDRRLYREAQVCSANYYTKPSMDNRTEERKIVECKYIYIYIYIYMYHYA